MFSDASQHDFSFLGVCVCVKKKRIKKCCGNTVVECTATKVRFGTESRVCINW